MINDACLAANKPAVYGGAYERAFAGEVIRVIPGEAGCYACVRQGLASTMRSISSQQVFDYTDDSEFQAEPGLGIDVSFIAMIHAKLALMTLLRDTPSTLGDIDAEMIIWINSKLFSFILRSFELRDKSIPHTFEQIVRLLGVKLDCPCGTYRYVLALEHTLQKPRAGNDFDL